MTAVFQVSDYYKLLALHKALMHAKFARHPIDPIISGSPFIAEMAEQIVSTLAAMEIERGYPERSKDWKMRVDPDGEIWQIALSRIFTQKWVSDKWKSWPLGEKKNFAKLLICPFMIDDDLLLKFIQDADQKMQEQGA